MFSSSNTGKKFSLTEINGVFQPCLIATLILFTLMQIVYNFTPIEHIYLAICQVYIVLLGICTICSQKKATRVLHYVYGLMIIITPFITKHPIFLLAILIIIIGSMALRAYFGRCVLAAYEEENSDFLINGIDDILNFNAIFFIAGVIYSVLLYKSK